ncbi:hypothetical protein DXG01_014200, partial [Tephrocybe rancida]
ASFNKPMTVTTIPTEDPMPPPAKRRRKAAALFRDPNFVLNDPELVDVLPVPLLVASDTELNPQDPIISLQPESSASTTPTLITPHNVFGVFRRYYIQDGTSMQQHDPDSRETLLTLSDIPIIEVPAKADPSDVYAPFPNKTSFLLSDWYWNRGAQKSKDSFRQLLRIIGSKDFAPGDIASTNWHRVDRQLGINEWDRE